MSRPVDNILSLVGNTPIVKINRLAPEGANLYVKLEAQNPLASVKDRLALGVIEDAERKGLLKPGQTIVEATSGNTGIALAMVCAAKGYPFVAVMIETFSIERRKIIKFLGGKVVLTPKELKGTGMVQKADELAKKHGWFQTKQFANPANPAYHRQTTGPEIVNDFVGKPLDYIVSGWGTGGTLTGVSAFVKVARPGVKIVAAEPAKAALLAGGSFSGHAIQGWAPDFIPEVLDRTAYDELVSVTDEDAIATSKLLAKKEGIFVGISSGATFAAALDVAKRAPKDSHILVILPDTAERYLSTPLFADISIESDEIEPASSVETAEVAAASTVKTTTTTTNTTTVDGVKTTTTKTITTTAIPKQVSQAVGAPIHPNVLSLIGKTPIVKINRLAPEGIDLFVKIESFNPLSSVKDRLALAVIEDAERRGVLKPGQTIVEATSGNTGIALALVCAVKGYPFVATMIETFSIERRKIIKFLGGKVVLTPKELKGTGMVQKADELAREHGWFQTKQFANPANPEFHRQTTGPEILKSFAGRNLDYIVSGWGTGGTLTGVSAAVKTARPDVKIVAAEPAKAQLLAGGSFAGHVIQGWAPDFIPEVLNRESYDQLLPVTDEDALATSKLLAKKEGIFVGISSGATFAAALELAKTAPKGSSILVILPDTAERYLSTGLFADISIESDVLETEE
ncbi:tryptophan synthase beta subunit-like PLP-dependent enzyme [Obelidium mucronatum]|nr:tryptophan synthase beta subunit-like PLP-dependent enzyme [Obelidium mucronatum]